MKKNIIFLVICFASMSICAKQQTFPAIGTHRLDVATSVKVGGFWAENWNSKDYKIATQVSKESFAITIYPAKDEVWNYYCRITLEDFSIPDKKSIRQHQKEGTMYDYKCKIEFFYNVQYPSIEECFANYGGFVVNSKDTDAKKRKVDGLISFNSYFFSAGEKFGDTDDKKMLFGINFDEVGMTVYLFDHLNFK